MIPAITFRKPHRRHEHQRFRLLVLHEHVGISAVPKLADRLANCWRVLQYSTVAFCFSIQPTASAPIAIVASTTSSITARPLPTRPSTAVFSADVSKRARLRSASTVSSHADDAGRIRVDKNNVMPFGLRCVPDVRADTANRLRRSVDDDRLVNSGHSPRRFLRGCRQIRQIEAAFHECKRIARSRR